MLSTLLWLVVGLLAVGLFIARSSVDVSRWLAVAGVVFLLLPMLGLLSWWVAVPVLAVVSVLALLAFLPDLRLRLLTGPVFRALKRGLPSMSDTERVAIEAGTVGWEAELFRGEPDYRHLHDYPKPEWSEKEQAFLDGPVEQLCLMIDDWEITHELDRLPEDLWAFIKENRFLGMIIPEEYGGLGFSHLGHSAVIEKLASRSISVAVTVMVPNSLGPAELLLNYGTQAQRDKYLSRLAIGEEIPCFALTGPEAGSDAGAIPDSGVVCKGEFEGREVLGLRLNWEKRYITLGPVATLLGLAFKAYDPDHLLGEVDELGITCALIPTHTPGVTIGRRHFPLNMAFQNGPNSGKDVFIPLDWVIGGEAGLGDGWRMLMESLGAGRGISLPALSSAGGKQACRMAGAYARVRKQFHLPVGYFEGVEEALARMGGVSYLMDSARTLTTSALDVGERPSVVTAILKYNLTELMRSVVNDAMDIHGGRGICLGPSNYLGRVYQSVPISITVEGANILTRSLIIFGQGALRCHPWLIKEMEAAHAVQPENGLQAFDRAFTAHLAYTTRNFTRAVLFGLSRDSLAEGEPRKVLHPYYRRLTRISSGFAFLADIGLAVLGGQLKRREKLSGRYADALSHMYLSSSVLKRFYDDGELEEDRVLAVWALEFSLARAEAAMADIVAEFPVRTLRRPLRWLMMPWGTRQRGPADSLGHKVARVLLKPSSSRERLTRGIFKSESPTDVAGRVEYALKLTLQAEPIERRLRESGEEPEALESRQQWLDRLQQAEVVSEEEATLLHQAGLAIRNAIMVDDFDKGLESITGSPYLSTALQPAASTATRSPAEDSGSESPNPESSDAIPSDTGDHPHDEAA